MPLFSTVCLVGLASVTFYDEPAQPRRGDPVEIRSTTASAPLSPQLFPEGAFLSERTGSIFKTAAGNLVFVADADPNGPLAAVSGPIAFLPCDALGKLEALAGIGIGSSSAPSSTVSTDSKTQPPLELVKKMTVSGQLFRFHNQHYLLLSIVPGEVAKTTEAPASTDKPADQAAPTPGKTAQDLISELESRRTTPRALETAAIAVAPKDAVETKENAGERAQSAKRKEGDLIASRQGRIVRHDAWLVFTPDSGTGAEGKLESDPPVVLLACKQLERLEWLAKQQGDAARYRVSGKITTYRGRNYLLPLMVQVLPPSDLTPRH